MQQAHLKIASPPGLTLVRGDGRELPVHPLWLRERCRDALSIDLRTQQRLQDPSDFDPDLKITAVTQPAAGMFRVRFSDAHEATFRAEDILEEAELAPNSPDCPAARLWDGSLSELPRVHWRAEASDAELLSWLESFLSFGFVIFEGVPTAPGTVLKVGTTFGFTRETNFGALFDVRSTPEANDLAYTSIALDPHTDNPYRSPVPGHPAAALPGERDERRPVDAGGRLRRGAGAAPRAPAGLRPPQPHAGALQVHRRRHRAHRQRTADRARRDRASSRPSISVRGSITCRSSRASALEAYYRARRLFDHSLRAPDFEIRFLLKAGDLVMFDNCRLLHGRTGFDPGGGTAAPAGRYIDIDGPRSLWRVLRRRLGALAAARRSA